MAGDSVLKAQKRTTMLFSVKKTSAILLLMALLAAVAIFASCGQSDDVAASPSDIISKSQENIIPVDVSMSDTEMTIGICTVHGISAKGGDKIVWSSSDNSIAVIDSEGQITGTGLGECDVTAENEYGKKAVCHVTVKKTAFITIDDGPLKYCGEILLKLNKLDVKATFFVVKTSNIAMVKQMHEDGHCVGLHTYSHKFSVCYRSEYSYFSDLEKLKDVIEEYTGERTNILRFPGGTSNTVMDRRGMRRMVSGLDDLGYRAFDWTASALDATGAPITYEQAAGYVLGSCIHDVDIILMHDKMTTAKAIEIIVDRLSSAGYVFDTLDHYANWSYRVNTWYERSVGTEKIPCTDVSLNEMSMQMAVGEKNNLTVKMTPDDSTDYVRFVSDDPSVVSVTLEGEITGMRVGSTTIRAIASSGQEADCRVTVNYS